MAKNLTSIKIGSNNAQSNEVRLFYGQTNNSEEAKYKTTKDNLEMNSKEKISETDVSNKIIKVNKLPGITLQTVRHTLPT